MILRKDIFGDQQKFGVLIDPDHEKHEHFEKLLSFLSNGYADVILIGGSTSREDNVGRVLKKVKSVCKQPILLFPGNKFQISNMADGILLPSLISGRNPEYLIGKHVEAASIIAKSEIPVFPMGYILIACGSLSTTSYVTQTLPIPSNQIELIVDTALAGQLLGFKCIYLEAGSGADSTVKPEIIKSVKNNINLPVIVGGGIKNTHDLEVVLKSRPDMVVVGNILETYPELICDFGEVFQQYQRA